MEGTFRSTSTYLAVPTFTNWLPGPGYLIAPGSSQTFTFTFYNGDFAGPRPGGGIVGLPSTALEFQVSYLKDGVSTTETFVVRPSTIGDRFSVTASAGDSRTPVAGGIQYRVKSIGLPTGVKQVIDGSRPMTNQQIREGIE